MLGVRFRTRHIGACTWTLPSIMVLDLAAHNELSMSYCRYELKVCYKELQGC